MPKEPSHNFKALVEGINEARDRRLRKQIRDGANPFYVWRSENNILPGRMAELLDMPLAEYIRMEEEWVMPESEIVLQFCRHCGCCPWDLVSDDLFYFPNEIFRAVLTVAKSSDYDRHARHDALEILYRQMIVYKDIEQENEENKLYLNMLQPVWNKARGPMREGLQETRQVLSNIMNFNDHAWVHDDGDFDRDIQYRLNALELRLEKNALETQQDLQATSKEIDGYADDMRRAGWALFGSDHYSAAFDACRQYVNHRAEESDRPWEDLALTLHVDPASIFPFQAHVRHKTAQISGKTVAFPNLIDAFVRSYRAYSRERAAERKLDDTLDIHQSMYNDFMEWRDAPDVQDFVLSHAQNYIDMEQLNMQDLAAAIEMGKDYNGFDPEPDDYQYGPQKPPQPK